MTTTRYIVDNLGFIRSQIASLREQEEALEAELKAQGAGSYEGQQYRATVSFFEQDCTSWKEVAAKLNPSRQLIVAHTKVVAKSRVTLSARLTEKLAA